VVHVLLQWLRTQACIRSCDVQEVLRTPKRVEHEANRGEAIEGNGWRYRGKHITVWMWNGRDRDGIVVAAIRKASEDSRLCDH
jgi:hypothetical protein